VSAQQPDLPGYEEIIASLAAKLEGLSTVHSGLGEAAESLVLVHYEIDETKRRIESLAGSTQSMVEEVQRLQPAELAASLDASLESISRESAESIGALSERVLIVASEVATRNRADEGLASLERQVTSQSEAVPKQLSELEESLTLFIRGVQTAVIDSLDSSRTAMVNSLTESEHATHVALQKIQGAFAILGERHDAISQAIVEIQRQQGELNRRNEDLYPLLTGINQQQTDFAQQIASISKDIAGIRKVVDATESTSIKTQQLAEKMEPALQASLRAARIDLSAEMAQLRRTQLLSLILVIAAIALAWASLSGLIPGA
jgi:predicted  nucleic acid-binding Zn-ribbon protein